MAFFDDIGNALSHAGQNVVQKTKDTAEVVRLNGAISEEEQRIQTLYSEIGKRYFELHANDYESALEEMVLGIKGANTKITQYRDQVMKLRGVIYCTGCHAEILVNAPGCPYCGTPNATAQTKVIRCKNCGLPLEKDAVFCTNCGTKAEPPAPTCTSCGSPLAEGALFCSRCGTKV